MNKIQIRRLASYQAISTHFDDHRDVWSTKAPIGEVITEWDRLLAEVREHAKTQAKDTTGATRTKSEQVDHVIELAMTLAKRLRSYARLRGDADLLPVVDVNKTELDQMNDVEMVDELADLTGAARERPADALAEFEVTPALLDELDAEAATIIPKEGVQRSTADDRTVATTRIRRLLSAFPPLRDVLDDLVDSMIDDEAFREGYYQARKVTG